MEAPASLRRRSLGNNDRGDTLVELLIATVIIGLVVSALLGALVVSLSGSVEHRSVATIDNVLKSFAESAKYDIQLEAVGKGTPPGPLYADCATTSSYRVLSTPSPSSGPLGTSVTVFGTGFTASSSLSVKLGSLAVPSLDLTSGGTSDAKGNVAVTFSVLANIIGLTPGTTYPVTVTDAGTPARNATSTEGFAFTAGSALPTVISPLALYTVAVSTIGWWNSTTKVWDPSTGGCQPGDKSGIEQITLKGTAQDHTSDSLSLVVANPATIAPVITSGNSTTFTAGVAGTYPITTTGFPTPALTNFAFSGPPACTPSPVLPGTVTFTDNGNGTATLAGTPGLLSGGTYTLCINATSSSGTATQIFTLIVDQPPAITSSSSAIFSTGTGSTFTFTSTGFPNPTFTNAAFGGCSPSGLPTGVTFTDNGNGTASLAGTPAANAGGIYTLCINATNSSGTVSQTFTLTVDQAPNIFSPSSTTFTVGTAGSFTVTASGFPAPTLSETGSLPSGVSFNPATGVLSGNPATLTGKAYSLTFKATNAAGTNTQSFTLIVNEAPEITSGSSATFTTATASNFRITSTGFPDPAFTDANFTGCTRSALPPGVTFTDNHDGTATLSGTPSPNAGGVYTLCINASNSSGTDTQTFTLTVDQTPAITSAGSTTFTVGAAGSFTVTATGFPAPTLSETGALPGGVSFNASTGVLSGTPAPGTGNNYSLTFKATSSAGTSTQTFTLTVNQSPAITSVNNVTFSTGTASSFTVTTSGFPDPALTNASFTGCTRSALPSGITFTDNGNGTATLAGTPAATAGGTYTLCLNASNSSGSATQTFILTVNQAPVITSLSTATFSVGALGTFTVTATGYPAPALSETATLPAWLSFNAATGLLSGTPPSGSGNTYGLTFKATSAAGTATQSFTLIVHEAPGFNSANNTAFPVGVPGTFTITTSGFPFPAITDANFTGCTVSTLPGGVTLHDNGNGTATLAGTPAAGSGGTYTLCLNAINGIGSPATQTFTLTVGQVPAITSSNSTTFTAGIANTFMVTTTGFPAPVLTNANFSGCTISTLPAGVTFTNNGNGTATLSGTPAGPGTYTVCVNATNSVGAATQTFTLTVVAKQAPTITSANSTTFTVGTAGSFIVTTTGHPVPAITNTNFGGCTLSTLPTGVTLTDNGNGTATLAGTPASGTGGVYTLCINATNGVGSPATQKFTLTVRQAPAITSDNSTTFMVGTAGTFTVTASGTPAPTFTETGALPTGVTLTLGGVLSGTPAAGTGGTYAITITAANGVNPSATQPFTLTVNEAPVITSPNSVDFTKNKLATPFTVTTFGFQAPAITNANFQGCTTTGLPAGVTFTDNGNGTATLQGTPPKSTGTYTLCLNAINGFSPNATQIFTLNVTN